jgi:hypothetical protein
LICILMATLHLGVDFSWSCLFLMICPSYHGVQEKS